MGKSNGLGNRCLAARVNCPFWTHSLKGRYKRPLKRRCFTGKVLRGFFLSAAFGRPLPPLQLGSHLSSRFSARADDKRKRAEKQIDLPSKGQGIYCHLVLGYKVRKPRGTSGAEDTIILGLAGSRAYGCSEPALKTDKGQGLLQEYPDVNPVSGIRCSALEPKL